MEDTQNPHSGARPASDGLGEVFPVYANNVRFESTAWDLRILFGQFMSASDGNGRVDWHTDVTIPWVQAKLMHLYLQINLALYERENGRITIPPGVLPPAMAAPPPGVDLSRPGAKADFERVRELIDAFRKAEGAES